MTLLELANVIFLTVAAGQLIVGGADKISQFRLYKSRVGISSMAVAIIAVDWLLGVWTVIGMPFPAANNWALAAFFVIGTAYRFVVVRSQKLEYCACSIAAKKTGMAEVGANAVMAAAAVSLALLGAERPGWFSIIATIVFVAFAGLWLRKLVARIAATSAAAGSAHSN